VKGFTEKYYVKKLVYFEVFEDAEHAIHREKCMKKWNREWKINLIEKSNPEWRDLFEEICY
jgi:putative endonuclease